MLVLHVLGNFFIVVDGFFFFNWMFARLCLGSVCGAHVTMIWTVKRFTSRGLHWWGWSGMIINSLLSNWEIIKKREQHVFIMYSNFQYNRPTLHSQIYLNLHLRIGWMSKFWFVWFNSDCWIGHTEMVVKLCLTQWWALLWSKRNLIQVSETPLHISFMVQILKRLAP